MDATFQASATTHQTSEPECELPPTLTIGANGCVVDASNGAEHFFDYPTGKLVGLHISSLVPALEDFEAPDQKNLGRAKYLSRCGVSFTAQTRNRQCFPCNLSIVTLHGTHKENYRVVLTKAASH